MLKPHSSCNDIFLPYSTEGPPVNNDCLYQMTHSRSHTPSLSHQYRPVTSVQPAQLDSSQWNTALSDLRHSIRQVRQDLGMSLQQDESVYPDDEDDIHSSYLTDDEHSTLSKTHTLSLVHS